MYMALRQHEKATSYLGQNCSAMATNLIATYNVRTLLRDQQMQEREEQVRETRSV